MHPNIGVLQIQTITQYTQTYKKLTGYHSVQIQNQTGSHNALKHVDRIKQCTKICTIYSITQCIQIKRMTLDT